MAYFKGDSRYTQTLGDAADDSLDSDQHSIDDELPTNVRKVYKEWFSEYYDDIEGMYNLYLQTGRVLFGASFHQLGRIDEFANFVFRYMQPGATT